MSLRLETIGPMVVPWKFDVLKVSILFLGTSNFLAETISLLSRNTLNMELARTVDVQVIIARAK